MSRAAGKLAERLEKESVKTIRFFSELADECWGKSVYTDGASWQVRQVLAHIVETESALPRLFKHIAAGGGGVSQEFNLNEYNEQAVARLEQTPPAQLIDLFAERRKQTVEFVGSLTDEDLRKEGNHPFLGHAPLEEMIRLFYLHVQLHIRDVRGLAEERKDS